jgi:hypothetical protein
VSIATHSLGSVLFGYPSSSNFDIIRHRDFPVAINDPAAFHALMLTACTYFDHLRGLPPRGARSVWHRLEAVTLLNRRLGSSAERNTEGTLHAVALMASIEHKWGTGHEVHVAGLHKLVVDLGGFAGLRNHPRLESTLFGFGLTNPAIAQLGSLAFCKSGQARLSSVQERNILVSEFWDFLTETIVHSISSPRLFQSSAQIVTPGSAIYNLLAASTWHATPLRPNISVRLHERARLSSLIYLQCTLLQTRGQADLDEFVRRMRWLLRCEGDWKDSLRMFQGMLVMEEKVARLRDSDLAWKSLRLLTVVEWLSPSSFDAIKKYLLALLSGGEWETALDVDRIREEVFSLKQAV